MPEPTIIQAIRQSSVEIRVLDTAVLLVQKQSDGDEQRIFLLADDISELIEALERLRGDA